LPVQIVDVRLTEKVSLSDNVKFLTGNIFDSTAAALVNPVNCVGVMGAGLAKEFRERFPSNTYEYNSFCTQGKMRTGEVLVHHIPQSFRKSSSTEYIINFPTKMHYASASEISYIEEGLSSLVKALQDSKIRSVAIPALGCGLGQLNWRDVRLLITNALSPRIEITVEVYEPFKK